MFADNLKFNPFWWEAAPRPDYTVTSLPPSADVVIVGSGFTGLCAALTLAKAGRQVLVLEANRIGEGASTRNGGQVGPGNQHFSVAQLIAIHGREKALALMSEGLEMLEHIAELVRDEQIDCHFARVGRFRGAVLPAHYETMARESEQIRRFIGMEIFMLPKQEQHTEIGSELYYGGAVLPNDASVHPGLLHQGLLKRITQLDAVVASHTPVESIRRDKQCVRVQTPRGEIQARDCIVTTNAYTTSNLSSFCKRVLPIGSDIIASEEIPAELMRKLMPKKRVMGETRRVFHYYRPCHHGKRILFGGRSTLGSANGKRRFVPLYKNMIKIFPELADYKVTHCWSGFVAYTQDKHPHLGKFDGIHYAMGYCGTGVSRSTYFGHKIALKVLGDANAASAFDDLDFTTLSAHFRLPGAAYAGTTVKRLQDYLKL